MLFLYPLCLTQQYGEKYTTQTLKGRTWLFFSSLFIVFERCDFGMLEESLLIPFWQNKVFILVFLLKIEMGRTSLVFDSLDMITVFVAGMG
jgi:hypothetical protein